MVRLSAVVLATSLLASTSLAAPASDYTFRPIWNPKARAGLISTSSSSSSSSSSSKGNNGNGYGKTKSQETSSSINPTACARSGTGCETSTASSTSSTSEAASSSSSATSTSTSTSSSATPTQTSSAWTLVQDWQGSSFFDGWDFFYWDDPTHGTVNYLDEANAFDRGLAYTYDNGNGGENAVIRVDDSTWLASGAYRDSVRITSKEKVKLGSIVIFDANKMPYGQTVWPAFWTVGADWPNGGEIDIVEGVHTSVHNQMTLHSASGCTLSEPMDATATVLTTNCDANVNYNIGCGTLDSSSVSFGQGFSDNGGGVFATHFAAEAISIWFFPRGSVPSDIDSGSPDISAWGEPKARFANDTCAIEDYFADQTIVINTTLCGDWAGSQDVYSSYGYSGSCADAVYNPNLYTNALFDINYVKVYEPSS